MPKYYRVNLKDKENNIIYPNIHNEIQIEQDGTIKLKSLIPLYDNSYILGNTNKAWNNIYSYGLALNNQEGTWTSMKDKNSMIYFQNQLSQNSYSPLFKMKTFNGHYFIMGGIEDKFFMSFIKADKIVDEQEYYFYFDTNSGVFSFAGDVIIKGGFYFPARQEANTWRVVLSTDGKQVIVGYREDDTYAYEMLLTNEGNITIPNKYSGKNAELSEFNSTIGGQRIALMKLQNDYYGLLRPDGGEFGYIRTPKNGLLPYAPASDTGTEVCYLGTPSWPFDQVNTKQLSATKIYNEDFLQRQVHYRSDGTDLDDSNTTTLASFLTSVNVPGNDYYYINSQFYANDNYRAQFAMQYTAPSFWQRIKYNGSWSNWHCVADFQGRQQATSDFIDKPYCYSFGDNKTGIVGVRLGGVPLSSASMIMIKGHIFSYNASTEFEASCYYYNGNTQFYACNCDISNPVNLRKIMFGRDANGYIWLLIGEPSITWSYPTVFIDCVYVGFAGGKDWRWHTGWTSQIFTDWSSFNLLGDCIRNSKKLSNTINGIDVIALSTWNTDYTYYLNGTVALCY